MSACPAKWPGPTCAGRGARNYGIMRASASARSGHWPARHLTRRPGPGNVLGSTKQSARGPPAQLRLRVFERSAGINRLLVA
eukprot:429633-Alexandrium_andersonii.AAC.1